MARGLLRVAASEDPSRLWHFQEGGYPTPDRGERKGGGISAREKGPLSLTVERVASTRGMSTGGGGAARGHLLSSRISRPPAGEGGEVVVSTAILMPCRMAADPFTSPPVAGQWFQLRPRPRGSLGSLVPESLHLEAARASLAPGEALIAVQAIGLNFRDVLNVSAGGVEHAPPKFNCNHINIIPGPAPPCPGPGHVSGRSWGAGVGLRRGGPSPWALLLCARRQRLPSVGHWGPGLWADPWLPGDPRLGPGLYDGPDTTWTLHAGVD